MGSSHSEHLPYVKRAAVKIAQKENASCQIDVILTGSSNLSYRTAYVPGQPVEWKNVTEQKRKSVAARKKKHL
jgi:hypothetical protein